MIDHNAKWTLHERQMRYSMNNVSFIVHLLTLDNVLPQNSVASM